MSVVELSRRDLALTVMSVFGPCDSNGRRVRPGPLPSDERECASGAERMQGRLSPTTCSTSGILILSLAALMIYLFAGG